jgi:hypothetical protein
MLIFYDPCTTGPSRTFGARKIAFRSLNHWPKDAPSLQDDTAAQHWLLIPPPITATPSMFCQANGGLAKPSGTCFEALCPDEAKLFRASSGRGDPVRFSTQSLPKPLTNRPVATHSLLSVSSQPATCASSSNVPSHLRKHAP